MKLEKIDFQRLTQFYPFWKPKTIQRYVCMGVIPTTLIRGRRYMNMDVIRKHSEEMFGSENLIEGENGAGQ